MTLEERIEELERKVRNLQLWKDGHVGYHKMIVPERGAREVNAEP